MHRFAVGLALILPGCTTHEEVVDLAGLGYVDMNIIAYLTYFRVEIRSGAHPCPILSLEASATLRGASGSTFVPITSWGGEDRSDEQGSCLPIIMHLENRPTTLENAELVIADDSLDAVIDLGGALSAPTATLVPAGPWELGSNRTYRVAPAQRVQVRSASSATITIADGGADPVERRARIEGDELVITTRTVPASGTGAVTIDLAGPQATNWDCVPITGNCWIYMGRTPIELGVTFVP